MPDDIKLSKNTMAKIYDDMMVTCIVAINEIIKKCNSFEEFKATIDQVAYAFKEQTNGDNK